MMLKGKKEDQIWLIRSKYIIIISFILTIIFLSHQIKARGEENEGNCTDLDKAVPAWQKYIVDIPASLIYNGKNITLVGFQEEKIGFNTDGKLGFAGLKAQTYVNGVNICVDGYSHAPAKAIFYLYAPFVCGDGICSQYEDHSICCTDCRCGLASQICLYNQCFENVTKPAALSQCNVDTDCDDKNPCTKEFCNKTALPATCQRTPIITCLTGDGCCPLACESDTDQDCAVIDKCKSKYDCNDNNPCTEDSCDGQPKRCKNTQQNGCAREDKCLPVTTRDYGMYCKNNQWYSLKGDSSFCKEAYECLSNSCTLLRCGTFSENFMVYAIYVLTLILVGVIFYSVTVARKKGKKTNKVEKQSTP